MENLIGRNCRITFQRKSSQWHSFDILDFRGQLVLLRGIAADMHASRLTFWQNLSSIDTVHPLGPAIGERHSPKNGG